MRISQPAILTICLISNVAVAAELNWSDLVRRPELWPTRCTLNRPVQLQRGGGVRAGQTVDVIEIHPNEVVVAIPETNVSFGVKPESTDVLAVATETWNTLTSAQRQLTYAALLQRKELWPYRVALAASFQLSGGMRVERGDRVVLMGMEGRRLLVLSERLRTTFNVEPQQTDLMAQARALVQNGQAVPGRLISELEGKLVGSVTGVPAPFDPDDLPRYIVLYRGSNTCPITRRFTPTLLGFYKDMKPKHPEFEVIYVRADNSVAEMQRFAKEMGFSWRAVNGAHELPLFGRTFGSKLPQILVMDRSGNVLANGTQATAPAALKQLQALLERPFARN